jgi:glycine betaine catabolism A
VGPHHASLLGQPASNSGRGSGAGTPRERFSEAFEAVRRPLGEAVGLPREAYEDPQVFAAETTSLFLPGFYPVARDRSLQAPGSRLVVSLFGDELLLVRGIDLQLRVFFNVCRHRGSLLVRPGDPDRSTDLVCPYHGQRYDLRGRPLRRLDPTDTRPCPVSPDGGDALLEGAVATWGGFVFVRSPAAQAHSSGPLPPDGAVPGLRPIPNEIEQLRLSLLSAAHQASWEIAANWKLVVENFLESHHYPSVHPALEARTPHHLAETLPDPAPWNGGLTILAPDTETVSSSGRRLDRRFLPGLAPEERDRVRDYHLWPLVLLSRQPDYLLVYRLEPLTPLRTRVFFSIEQHPASPREGPSVDDIVSFWTGTNDEDRGAIERQQRGIRSRGYRPGRLSPLEDGLHRFLVEVVDFYDKNGIYPAD